MTDTQASSPKPGTLVQLVDTRRGRHQLLPMLVTHVDDDGFTGRPGSSGWARCIQGFNRLERGHENRNWQPYEGGPFAGDGPVPDEIAAALAKRMGALPAMDEIVEAVLEALDKRQEATGEADEDEDEANAEEALIETIKDAIRSLDPDDKSLYTGSGEPRVEVLEAILKREITADQRTAAHQAVLAERRNA